ncbi:MAG: cyclophilin-like fold protein [Acutalibacteraceae bacterium]
MYKRFLYSLILVVMLSACTAAPTQSSNTETESKTETTTTSIEEENSNIQVKTIEIVISGKTYEVELYDNQTAEAFINLLPMSATMQELNGNEKYYYLPETLPSNAKTIGEIKVGDIMLWGDNCLVIFYKNFHTSYRYTKIGTIKNMEEIAAEMSSEEIKVFFQK